MQAPAGRMTLKVAGRRDLATDIREFTLVAEDGRPLPGFSPGAHVTVQTPGGAMRRYSLVNDGRAPTQYVIAVKKETQSRGGSVSMHQDATESTTLIVDPPENDFELVEAPAYLLIAGGIGVTPILAMARSLSAQGKPFTLIYCTRSASESAYLDEIGGYAGAIVHHDEGDADRFYDFWDHFAEPGNAHVYCCGPAPLMEEIRALSGHWTEGRVHFEDFNAVSVVREDDRPFNVTLARSGKTVAVPADRSILEALRDAGVETVSSCESGTCGTCKCGLIEGRADHRDLVLMDEEKDRFIMICVSRALEGDLVVDL